MRRKPQPKTLSDFLQQKGAPTQDALAKQLSITPAYVSLLASGKRQPSLKLAFRIEKLTGVPASSLVSEVAA